MGSITEGRRKAVTETLQTVEVEELKKIGEGLFSYVDHPWREPFFKFLEENAGATFYHATTDDKVEIFYCREKERGIWVLPGSGMGPLPATAAQTMKEIVAKA
ncbi:MAG TPA: hypothetical protein VGH90_02660 [Chthoniobacteraceae bacterium]